MYEQKKKLYRTLAKMYGWTFTDIANMTERQQFIALEQDDNTEDTITFQDQRQYEDYINASKQSSN